jgi:hypothetical protein
MSTGVLDLATPFERHRYLPTAMNWLGPWNPTTVYYNNDIVLSPISNASYILLSPASSIQGGGDPSTNPEWYAYGGVGGDVVNLTGRAGIKLNGSDTNPIVDNDGVISISTDTSLVNIGTDANVVLETTGVLTLGSVLGISITEGNKVNNTGVLGLTPTAGIDISGSNTNLIVTNNGILSMASANANLTVSAGTSPIITNNGILSVVALTGITNTGTPTAPVLSNAGVVDISGDNSIIIGGTAQNPTLAANNPATTLVWRNNGTIVANPPTWGLQRFGNGTTINVPQEPGTLWASCMATGVPYAQGIFKMMIPFMINYSGRPAGGGIQGDGVRVSLFDSVANVTYNTLNPKLVSAAGMQASINFGYNTVLGDVLVDIAEARATGFRQLSAIKIVNPLVIGAKNVFITLGATGGPCFATYSKPPAFQIR